MVVLVVIIAHLTAHHTGNNLLLRHIRYHHGIYLAAVTKNRYTLTDLRQLLQTVSNIYNCNIILFQNMYLLEQCVNLMLGQG